MIRDSAQSDEVLFRGGLTKTDVVHQPGDDGQPLTSVAYQKLCLESRAEFS